MSITFSQEAAVKRPPRGNLTGSRSEVFVTSLTTTALTPTLVLPSGIPLTGGFVTWVCDGDVYIRVDTTSTMATATSGDWVIPAFTVVEWRHDEKDAYFSAAAVSGTCTIRRYLSNS